MSSGIAVAFEQRSWIKKIGLGILVGVPWSMVVEEMVRQRAIGPDTVHQFVEWGPAFGLLILGAVMVERWAPRILAVFQDLAQGQQRSADSQQKLADAVTTMSERGDRDTRETVMMLGYTNKALERMHERFGDVSDEVGEMRNELSTGMANVMAAVKKLHPEKAEVTLNGNAG